MQKTGFTVSSWAPCWRCKAQTRARHMGHVYCMVCVADMEAEDAHHRNEAPMHLPLTQQTIPPPTVKPPREDPPALIRDAPNLARHEHGLDWHRIAGREIANLDRLALVVSSPHPDGGFSFGVVESGADGAVVIHREGRAETRANARRDAVLAAGDVLGVVSHETMQAMATAAQGPAVTGWVRRATYLLLGAIFIGSAALVAGVIVSGLRAAGVIHG